MECGVGCNIGAWGVEMLVCGDGKVMRWGVISSNFLIYICVCVHICYCFALYSLIHTLYGFMVMVNVIKYHGYKGGVEVYLGGVFV